MTRYKEVKKFNEKNQELAIRFGLGAIKAVGVEAMKEVALERRTNGNFKDIYDLSSRMGKAIANKKVVEALAKSGSLINIHQNRRQIVESCEIITKFANSAEQDKGSSQMNLFDIAGSNFNNNPPLKQVDDWQRPEKLHNEFQAFGFFLLDHPISDYEAQLKKRGATKASEIEGKSIRHNHIIYVAGVVAGSKHKTGPRGRYCYLTISDPTTIFDISIFDEDMISRVRDLIEDGQYIVAEVLVRKEEGDVRLLAKDVHNLDEFVKSMPEINCRKHTRVESKKRYYDKNSEGGGAKKLFTVGEGREDKLLQKAVIAKALIKITSRDGVLNLKNFLSKMTVSEEKAVSSTTEVILSVSESRLSLQGNIMLSQDDVENIKHIDGVEILD